MDYHGCFRVSFWVKSPLDGVCSDINLQGVGWEVLFAMRIDKIV